MKTNLLMLAVALGACGTGQSLATAQQQFDALTAEARDASNCGQQNAACAQSATPRNPSCRAEMRACIGAPRPSLAGLHSPALDALHACNLTYDACSEGDAGMNDDDALDGGVSDCEAAHRACLCTAFSNGWADFCADVAANCANVSTRECARLLDRCAQPAPRQPGLCE